MTAVEIDETARRPSHLFNQRGIPAEDKHIMLDRPSIMLRLEEASMLLASVLLYRHLHFSWLLFAILFLAPDLFMLGYLFNVRVGASLYNLGHALFLAIPLFLFGYLRHSGPMMAVALIWSSHIAWDRLVGYGFKYPTHFKDTHLQHLG